jgi:hypothetical protein
MKDQERQEAKRIKEADLEQKKAQKELEKLERQSSKVINIIASH